MADRRPLALAAKFDRTGKRYHPLLFHMLDTAAVALALWDVVLPPDVRRLTARGLGVDENAARHWLAVVCGLHDLGKATQGFQSKDPGARDRLAAVGIPIGSLVTDVPHGLVTAVQLARLLAGKGIAPRVANHFAVLVGGHHGVFPLPQPGQGQGAHVGERDELRRSQWDSLRLGLFDAVWQAVGVPELPRQLPGNAASMVMAGLTTLSDWIASNETLFPWACAEADGPLPETQDYWQGRALPGAAEALRQLHWVLPQISAAEGFGALFPGLNHPRPVQEATLALSLDQPPECLIIEAPTGEGKTEAAFVWLAQWARRGARGGYVAMPTQATSNQLYERLRPLIGRLFDQQPAEAVIPYMLVHGTAELMHDQVLSPSAIGGEDGRDGVTVQAAEWFLPRKRSLLAPFGVGTIDQALLAALRLKHVFVRLLGLAGKPVIFDEVHAYDTYVSALLERLLEWLGALGSPVALLSATLPTTRRRALLDAYLRGAATRDGSDGVGTTAEVETVRGPGLTYARPAEVGWRPLAVRPEAIRRVRLARIDDDPAAVAQYLSRALARGGCAAVVCNTVARAQATYVVLRDHFGRGVCQLFHSRFLLADRQVIERDCLAKFGPPRDGGVRPALAILVATQVIEQSLDLDFDVLVTDLAPLDLIIQRAGRLQRHLRTSRPVSGEPTLAVRWPSGTPPAIDPGTLAVYSEHILLRTWAVVRDRDSITVPDDVPQLIEYVYSDTEEGPPPDVAEALAERWRETWAELQDKRTGQLDQARDRRLLSPEGPTRLPSEFQRSYDDEDDLDLDESLRGVTRLATPTIDVVLLPSGDPLIEEVDRGSDRMPRDIVRRLLLRSVGISSSRVVAATRHVQVPPRFAATPGLRRHRLLQLDASDCAVMGDVRLRLDPELGVLVESGYREATSQVGEVEDAAE